MEMVSVPPRMSHLAHKVTGMRNIIKPAWLIFAEECRRDRMSKLRFTKSGKREEETIYGWYREACDQYKYPGTEADWWFLMDWRGRR